MIICSFPFFTQTPYIFFCFQHKTVQHFPPLSSTASTAVSSSSSAVAYENVRQTSSGRKQQKQSHRGTGSGNAASIYRPRTKQSKINLTPFTPSNSVPGSFVPIVYTPVNSNNNNNNNILNSPAVSGSGVGGEIIDSTSYRQEENQQYHKQQLQNPPHHQPQQIAIEYSSGPLPPSVSAASIPIDVQPVAPQRPHHPHHLQHQQRNHHNPKQQSQQQYYSVTTSPVNVDLTHDVVSGLGGGLIAGDSLNAAHHSQHHHQHSHPPLSAHNTDAIRYVLLKV